MTFEELIKINVNEYTEKKGKLTYLSWTYAWQEFKKAYPDAKYEIKDNPMREDGLRIFGNSDMGYEVRTSVTATVEDDGLVTHDMWLPVMDYKNASIKTPTSMDINKATMRCLVKNIAMFGLGLYIYAGEDLPEGAEEEQPKDNFFAQPKTVDIEAFRNKYKTMLMNCEDGAFECLKGATLAEIRKALLDYAKANKDNLFDAQKEQIKKVVADIDANK